MTHDWINVMCRNCGHSHAVMKKCDNRFCSECRWKENRAIQNKMNWIISTAKLGPRDRWYLVTFTVMHDHDLARQVSLLQATFRAVRDSKKWKPVRGGFWRIEVKPAKDGTGWHAHIHALVWARWLEVRKLRDLWCKCAGGPKFARWMVQDIRMCPPDAAARYVTKYLTKTECSMEDQCWASRALLGRRLFFPLAGSVRTVEKRPKVIPECEVCGDHDWIPDFILRKRHREEYEYLFHLDRLRKIASGSADPEPAFSP